MALPTARAQAIARTSAGAPERDRHVPDRHPSSLATALRHAGTLCSTGEPNVGSASMGEGVMEERLEVQRTIAAEPAAIFRVLCDPHGHVQIDSSGMLMSAEGAPVTAVGDTFVVHMDREALNDLPLGKYDVTVKIVKFEPDREIAWTPTGNFDIGHVYGYRLEPIGGGTLVTSYYDWSIIDDNWRELGMFPVVPESALRATLGILTRTVEAE
jgi:hypothetical protein